MIELSTRDTEMLDWLASQRAEQVAQLEHWASINTHTFNLSGIELLNERLLQDFSSLQAAVEQLRLKPLKTIDDAGLAVEQPLARSLLFQKRPEAERKVLLVIHTDTVYPQNATNERIRHEGAHLLGPGVADAKGGISVLLWALKAFERTRNKKALGWTVLLNSDEEMGSLGSLHLLQSLALNHDLGLVFEPCLPNGDLVGARKGSGNFTWVFRGRAAHAGREPEKGRNAIVAMSQCIRKLDALNNALSGISVNVGRVSGGGALNVVPDLAVLRFNVRTDDKTSMLQFQEVLQEITHEMSELEGIECQLDGGFTSPPKVIDAEHQKLFTQIQECGKVLGLNLSMQATGGVCDGNKLSAAGLPNIDTLGVRGGAIHSPKEYCVTESLSERAQLVFLLLQQLNEELPSEYR